MPRRQLLLAVLLVVALLTAGVVVTRRPAPGTALPDTLRVYVAVPADITIDYGLADGALHEADLAIRWLEQQTGMQLRRGPDFARVVALSEPAAVYRGQPHAAATRIMQDVERAVSPAPDVFPLVLADVRSDDPDARLLTCGLGGRTGVVMLLGNCLDHRPSTASSWPSAASYTIAHELVHGLGGVAPCGRSATADGHVIDDGSDVMAAVQTSGRRHRPVTFDVGRDDYFGHGIPGCPDIADSPLWELAAPAG